ncbi:MAG: ABC transporter ATP-binding protein [Gemmatimonadetes bacterium]|nr:ABC transporter ATP-binding protein [Gemmatimonadota bacterium]MYA42399.1 ABC transporter ATP-binding protein [Gemmatimonadota bacterium]MYE94334.1 ABC transporter ATP-binding protein [Gemmatimonadota bacterium]MYJ12142.1 ABC transporter ATP-binding protein [Gemmatimonadota bacterium]
MSQEHDGYEDEVLGKAYDSRLMARLLQYLRPYALQVAGAVVLLLLASLAAVIGPYLTMIALDEAIPANDGRQLALLAIVYLAITVLVFVFQYVQALVTTWLGQRVMYDLRTQIFRKLQELDLRFYDRNPVGRLMTRITSDVETLNELFSSGLVTVFGDLFMLFFIVAAMLQMDADLALVTFSVLPFVAWAAFVFRSRIRSAYRDIRYRLARMNAFLQERFTGIRVVQLFNREDADLGRFKELNNDYLDAHLRSITYYALFFPIIQQLTSVALALIIWYGGSAMIQGAVTIGVLAAFLDYARRFFRPIQDLSEKYNLLQGAMASSERIFRLLDREPAIQDAAVTRRFPKGATGEIRFENVWFAYGNREVEAEGGGGVESRRDADGQPDAEVPPGSEAQPDWVIRDLSFTVAPGEKLAIVGHTGAGKTTVINLLMRFYEAQRGRILVDGIPIEQLRMQDLRARIGLVLQDIFLFSKSVDYNVRLGSGDIGAARVADALEAVGATPFVERLPDGSAQELGERGARLSVGERQLLSFARALAFDPGILVLDEATSSVDSEIEARIEEATDRLMRGRTSLVIAHRLSTVQGADRILVMHHGRLVEEGSHEELLARDGLYRQLHELQFAVAAA